MDISTQLNQGVARIKLNGRFTFDKHLAFNAALKEQPNDDCRMIEIDFGQVDYLDSYGLGLLLLARDRAIALRKDIALINCRGRVKSILGTANFKKLFTIS